MSILDSLTEQEWAAIKAEAGTYAAVKVPPSVLTITERRGTEAA